MAHLPPVPVLDAKGNPVHLLIAGDRNFLDLAAQLKAGQELSGRVVELLAPGKAVINFRGIQVTAELAGVKLAKGEMITVLVRDLGSSPAFQLMRPALLPAAAARLVAKDAAAASVLDRLGLPRDAFHGTVVRLLMDYGVPPSREEVAAVKDLITRLPAELGSPAPATPATQEGQMRGEATPGLQAGQMRGEATPGLQAGEMRGEATPGLQAGQMRGEASSAAPAAQAGQMRGEAAPGLQAGLRGGETLSAAPATQEGQMRGETSPARSLVVSPRVMETAVFLRASGLPAHAAIGRAVFEFLFGEARLAGLLAGFASQAGAFEGDSRIPGPVRDAAERASSVARRIQVSFESGNITGQLRELVEGMGLRHEPDLMRFLAQGGPESAAVSRSGGEGAPESLKAALLHLRAEILRAPFQELPADARASLAGMERAAAGILQTIEAQQVGSSGASETAAQAYVQIPLAVGAEISSGEMHVSWKKDREGRKRDFRAPAQMTIRLSTRALGALDVRMQLYGKSLAISINVKDEETRDFIRGELRWLIQRLSERNFRVDRCVCDLPPQLDGASLRSVEASPSLDVRA